MVTSDSPADLIQLNPKGSFERTTAALRLMLRWCKLQACYVVAGTHCGKLLDS